MADKLPRVTESGVHESKYGDTPEIAADKTLSTAPSMGFIRSLITPFAIFVVSLVGLAAFSNKRAQEPSGDNHFVYQADAFLKGQLELPERPPHDNDWASWIEFELRSGQVVRGVWYNRAEDKFVTLSGELLILDRSERVGAHQTTHYFVSFPPGPALLMAPFVAIWGFDFNDVMFTLFFGALNLALLYILLRRLSRGGRSSRSPSDNVWLVFVMGFSTVYLSSAILGQVWFTALIVGVTFTLLYLLFSIDGRRPLLAGLFLACAFATRTPLLFTAFIFPAFVLFPGGRLRRTEWGRAILRLALFFSIPLVVGCGLLYMNYLRFEDPTEFGHRYLATGQLDRIRDYGLFNYHFLARNISAALTLLPRFQPSAPYVLVSKHGMSLFLTTPVFFYLFRPRPRTFRQDVFWHRVCWAAVLVIAIPHFFYQNTGWEQFGYRFSLDYTPYLIVLLAIGRYPFTWAFKLLTIFGFAVNAFGAITFKRMPRFYTDWFFDP